MPVVLAAPVIVDSDDALARLSRDNPGYRIEREEDGSITMSPTHTSGGEKSAEALGQLYMFAKRVGGKAYDSSTGCTVGPGKKTLSPDASWMSAERIAALRLLGKTEKYWPISPDVTIEIKSDSDDCADPLEKADFLRKRGCPYAAAVDPDTREVVELGTPPDGLEFDFDALIDA